MAKYKKQNKNKYKDKSCCRCISLKEKKKDGLYNTYHELLPDKWIVKRSQFQASSFISPQSVAIFTTSYLVGCIKYYYNSLQDKVDRVQSQHPIKYIGLTIHSKTSLVRKSDNIKSKTQKPCNENPSAKSTDLLQTQRFTES